MRKVFVIDDDDIVIYLTKLIINESLPDLEVVSFEYASDSIAVLQKLVATNKAFPEYILLDINMPMVDGWDFLEVYKEFPFDKRAQCKLMIYSSSISPSEESRAKSYTCVADYVSKPITTETLASVFSK
jgi:CheY-like chemotaxis protein